MLSRRSVSHRIRRERPSTQRPGVLLDLEESREDPKVALFQTLLEENEFQPDEVEVVRKVAHKRAAKKKALVEESLVSDDEYDDKSDEPEEDELRRIAAEIDDADDFSLYMENEETGVRQIQYHGQLLDWTEELRAKKDEEKKLKFARQIWIEQKPAQRKPTKNKVSARAIEDTQEPSTSQSPESSALTEVCPGTPTQAANSTVFDVLVKSIARIPIGKRSSCARTIIFDPILGRCLDDTRQSTIIDDTRQSTIVNDEDNEESVIIDSFVKPADPSSFRSSKKSISRPNLLDHKIKLSPIRRLSQGSTRGSNDFELSQYFEPPAASTPVRSAEVASTQPSSSYASRHQNASKDNSSFNTAVLDTTPCVTMPGKSFMDSKKRISLDSTAKTDSRESVNLELSTPGSDILNDQKRRRTSLLALDSSSDDNKKEQTISHRATRSLSRRKEASPADDIFQAATTEPTQPSAEINATMQAEIADPENNENENMATLQLTMNDRTGMTAMTNSILLPQANLTGFSNFTMGGNATNLANITNMTNMTALGKNQKQNLTVIRNESIFEDRRPFYLQGYHEDGLQLSQLMHVINQKKLLQWDELPSDVLKKPRKLGEGTYGEVFATKCNGKDVALKIMPIVADHFVSDLLVNGEHMNSAIDVIPEVIITKALAALHDESGDYSTPNFIPLISCQVVQGTYPKSLLSAWDTFDKKKLKESKARGDDYPQGSENDRPSTFSSRQQLHLAIGLKMGGVDLESYKTENESQVLSILLQIALSFVVAEHKLQFEHRDCHLGNVLVECVNSDLISYRIAGQEVGLKSHGAKCNIIDFTLSRLKKAGTTLFRNCEEDEELFSGQGSYQFEIYRMMRKEFRGDWSGFHQKSNVFWLHYLATELIQNMDCKKKIPAKRKAELMRLFDELLKMERVSDMLTSTVFAPLISDFLVKPDNE